jgi:hypothetical protein
MEILKLASFAIHIAKSRYHMKYYAGQPIDIAFKTADAQQQQQQSLATGQKYRRVALRNRSAYSVTGESREPTLADDSDMRRVRLCR